MWESCFCGSYWFFWIRYEFRRNVRFFSAHMWFGVKTKTVQEPPRLVDSHLGGFLDFPHVQKWVERGWPALKFWIKTRFFFGITGSFLNDIFLQSRYLVPSATPVVPSSSREPVQPAQKKTTKKHIFRLFPEFFTLWGSNLIWILIWLNFIFVSYQKQCPNFAICWLSIQVIKHPHSFHVRHQSFDAWDCNSSKGEGKIRRLPQNVFPQNVFLPHTAQNPHPEFLSNAPPPSAANPLEKKPRRAET